ncbi:TonB-dependent receptor [Terriglobus sp. TAA 43]|uniref:TonB-dependent receptor n=1 Tax=Terriglobus sp. TAA 43 TaxID=278961 RepID=UPI0012EEDA39|nr:TonB-dependent receptor [Terriglobus sp. TAA 43]
MPGLSRIAVLLYPRRTFTALLLSVAAVPAVMAQDASTGALNGVVRDPSGAVLSAATLTLRDVQTGQQRTLQSDRLGEFYFPSLTAGTYVLSATATGFTPLQVNAVSVAVGKTTRLMPQMQIGGVRQEVEVTASPTVEFDSPLNANLSPQQLQMLPLDGRRFQSLAVLTPLVAAEDANAVLNPAEESAPQAVGDTDNARLSIRAQDPALNRFTLDGEDHTRQFDMQPRGGGALPFAITQEAVQEFGVRAVADADSSQPHGAGGALRTITRRGGEDVHGSAFFLIRNSAGNATNPFSTTTRYNNGSPTTTLVKPRDQREQFGGSIGGRLGLHSTYGFVAVDGQRRSFPAISSPSDSAFYSLKAVQRALLANRGVSTTAIAKGLAYIDSLSGTLDRHANEVSLFPRLDWDTARSNTSAQWNRVRFDSAAGQNALPVVARGRGSIGSARTEGDDVLLHTTAMLHRRWSLDARIGYSRDVTYAESPTPLPQEPHTGPGGSAPQVDLSDAFSFGSAPITGLRRLPDERNVEAGITLQFHGRAHQVSVGTSLIATDERIAGSEANNGRYLYANSTAAGHAGSLVDFLTDYTYNSASYPNGGCPSIYSQPHYFCFSSFTQTFGSIPEARFHTAEWSAFVSDRWRVTPRLHINAGARYEWDRLPPPQHPNASIDAVFGGFAATQTMPSDTNDLAPFGGISYAPTSGTVVRVGYGFQFSSIPGTTIQRALANTAQTASQTQLRITPRTIIDPACASYGTNFGYPATYTCAPFGPLAATGAAWAFSRSFQMPTAQTAELSVSQQIATRTHISGSYVLAMSRELTDTVDLNIAPSTSNIAFRIVRNGGEAGASGGDVFHVPLYTARKTSAFGPVTAILSDGNGTYHAMALSLEHQTPRSLTLRASWTYSKSLDTVRTGPTASNENAHFDPYSPLYDRAPSNFDHRHRVTMLAVWQPHAEMANAFLRAVGNGWSLSPVLLFQSGRPYSYNLSGGSSLPGGRESLNNSGGANYLPSVGRNSLRLPWTENVDVSLSRAFAIKRDRVRLRLMMQAYNLLNHVNVTTVEQRAFLVGSAGADGVVPLTFQDAATITTEGVTGKPFGMASQSANSPTRERRLQAGLRFEW